MKVQNQKPLVSVLLPVFNIGHFLPTCLDSLLSQNYEDIEIIAVDDLSRDDSLKILRLYKKTDKRLKVYANVKHYGKGITLNRAVKKAKGKFIALMDGKDIVYKERFTKQVKFLIENEKVVAVGTQCNLIDPNSKKLGRTSFPQEYDALYHKPLHTVSINFESVMINRHLLPKDLIKFNINEKTMLYSDLLIKLIQYGKITNLPLTLQYRRTDINTTQTSIKDIPDLLKLWIKSIDSYDYKPSFRSFFSSVLRPPTLSTQ
ncbi:MAG TPA: glycosyltransferase family A protein [Patescibacteria group bacterium]